MPVALAVSLRSSSRISTPSARLALAYYTSCIPTDGWSHLCSLAKAIERRDLPRPAAVERAARLVRLDRSRLPVLPRWPSSFSECAAILPFATSRLTEKRVQLLQKRLHRVAFFATVSALTTLAFVGSLLFSATGFQLTATGESVFNYKAAQA